MDIVASPATGNDLASDRQLPETAEHKASLTTSGDIVVEGDNEHPSELNKPPLLKHVYVELTISLAVP